MCDIPRCRSKDVAINYMGLELCERCWMTLSRAELKEMVKKNG